MKIYNIEGILRERAEFVETPYGNVVAFRLYSDGKHVETMVGGISVGANRVGVVEDRKKIQDITEILAKIGYAEPMSFWKSTIDGHDAFARSRKMRSR